MTSVYEFLVQDLCILSHLKGLSFNHIFRLINQENSQKIKKYDLSVQDLYNKIVSERERIGTNLAKKLNDLIWINEELSFVLPEINCKNF
jgi:hypothetical protein